MINIVLPYLKKQGIKRIFLMGLCWGGLMAINILCKSKFVKENNLTGGIVIHAARLTQDLMKQLTCPMAIMPTLTDGDYTDLKQILDEKEFGKKCAYRFYKNQIHGFMAARGDWSDEKIKVDVDDALKTTVEFCTKLC